MPDHVPDVFSDHGGRFPWRSRLLDVGGGVRQAYIDEGPREAPLTLLCAHGNPTWGFLYRAFVVALSREHRVLVPDHVGFGRSDKPPEIGYYTLERHIANLSCVLEAADARNVVPVVQDWGGPIALGWATRHASRVAGTVILNTWAFVRNPALKLPLLFKLLVRGAGGYRRVTEKNFFVETILGRLGTVRPLPKPVLDAYRAAHPRPRDRVGIAAFPRMIPETRDRHHPEWATMAAIEDALGTLADKPALIVWATRDRAFRQPQLDRWRGLLRHADGPHLVRAGHFLQEDAPDEIINRIRAWLPALGTGT